MKTYTDHLYEETRAELVRQLRVRIGWLHRPALLRYLHLLLRSLRYHHVKTAQGLTGVDLTARLHLRDGVTKILIRVRDYGLVPLNAVDELRGVMLRTNIRFGILFTTASFTKPALDQSNAVAGYPVSLIDLEGIARLSLSGGLGVRKHPLDSSVVVDEQLFETLEHQR